MGTDLEKRGNSSIVGENAQYALAFGVIAVMLYVIGLPAFVIFFLGAFSFFLWKLFSSGSASETRRIFEFFLSANEILRSEDRRWYGFEIQEAILRGEKIVATMHTAPPLVAFALGALYHKRGDFSAAIRELEHVFEENGSRESSIVFPTNELREYVRVLRKIEREPAEAPQTSAAIRSLERLRKNKGKAILDDARHRVHEEESRPLLESNGKLAPQIASFSQSVTQNEDRVPSAERLRPADSPRGDRPMRPEPRSASAVEAEKERRYRERKPISEVLQDIYDDKVS